MYGHGELLGIRLHDNLPRYVYSYVTHHVCHWLQSDKRGKLLHIRHGYYVSQLYINTRAY